MSTAFLRLSSPSSPHLRAHATQAIDWFPWCEEAFDEAKKRQLPLLVSLGFAPSHQNERMREESFCDPQVEKAMNAAFICIKVDRSERPDLDRALQRAALALTGQGGWPLSVFLTPEGLPFFAASFLPREDRKEAPGFLSLLKKVTALFDGERAALTAQADKATELLRHTAKPEALRSLGENSIRAAVSALSGDFDARYGGFGRSAKFPPTAALLLLLRRHAQKRDVDALTMVTRTLDAMMTGGVYDHLGGGFFRCTIDRAWSRPQFEKTLSDNAQLARVFTEAFQVTGFPPYARIARETLRFILRDLETPDGAFYSSTSADADDREGGAYLLKRSQVQDILGDAQAEQFCAFFGISEEVSLSQVRRELHAVASELDVDVATLTSSLEEARAQLFLARQSEVELTCDEIIVTAESGMAISALSYAAAVFGEGEFLVGAKRAADLLLSPSSEGGHRLNQDGFLHSSSRGEGAQPAFSSDYFEFALGLVSLYESCGVEEYLVEALRLAEIATRKFSDDASAALRLSSTQDRLTWLSSLDATDNAFGNENAAAVSLLQRLAVHFNRPDLKKRAEQIALAFAGNVRRQPRSHCALLAAVDALLDPGQAVIVKSSSTQSKLGEALVDSYAPHRITAHFQDPSTKTKSALTELAKPVTEREFFIALDHELLPNQEIQLALLELEKQSRTLRRVELGQSPLVGRATDEGTEKLLQRRALPFSAYTSWGKLKVSRLGLGTHRVGLDLPAHRAALKSALLGGINLIDTSPTFALGDSERLIGEVLADLADQDQLHRNEVVVVSKVGVLLGDEAEALAHTDETAVPLTRSENSAVEETREQRAPLLRGGAFCIHPTWIKRQIATSLTRLGLEHLDFCLIQSPEHLLGRRITREDFERLLLEAFLALESEVEAGRIGAYGIFTNTLAASESPDLRLDLQELLSIAHKAQPRGHSLKLIELPLNLIESAAVDLRVGSGELSLAEITSKNGITVVAARPLSAFLNGALLRLVDPPQASDGATPALLKSARYKVASLEAEFETTLAVQLRLSKLVGPEAVLPVSGRLGMTLEKMQTRQQFEQAEATLFTPQLRQLIGQLDQAFGSSQDASWPKFRARYIQAVGSWLAAVRETTTEENRRLLAELNKDLESGSGPLAHEAQSLADRPWTERSLLSLIRCPGVSSAVVGLRTETQTAQVLQLLSSL